MTDDFYKRVDCADDIDSIEGLRDINFDAENIPDGVPVNHKYAYLVKKVAFDLDLKNRSKWQHYWFRCCISDKCNYIFSILKSKNVDREEDLKRICNPCSELWKERGDEEMQGYVDMCIDFFLKRYNLGAAYHLWRNNPPITNMGFFKLLLPRLLSAILIGFIPIATSEELQIFTVEKQSSILYYCIIMLLISIIYIIFECHKTIRKTVVERHWWLRIVPVLVLGLSYSLIFSYILTTIGFLVKEGWNGSLEIVLFYAMFAFLVGILIQLLWEEKTVTEPL